MDTEQRHAAADAVREAMDVQGWNAEQLAENADIGVGTVRDFLFGRRWPRMAKRHAMEDALGWEPGTIAKIAHQARRAISDDDEDRADDPVVVALERSKLTSDERWELISHYLQILRRRNEQSSQQSS